MKALEHLGSHLETGFEAWAGSSNWVSEGTQSTTKPLAPAFKTRSVTGVVDTPTGRPARLSSRVFLSSRSNTWPAVNFGVMATGCPAATGVQNRRMEKNAKKVRIGRPFDKQMAAIVFD
ncbi:MAG: hypothetical protein FJW26_06075 [Acidimicrobiia bacterium]|nr:hypothetical protein [Acidimicrobiia bacterium]